MVVLMERALRKARLMDLMDMQATSRWRCCQENATSLVRCRDVKNYGGDDWNSG